MVQPNSQYGNSVYFPYAVGSLIAYAFENEVIKSEYSFQGFFYKKEDIEDCIGRMESPFAVGFSCYVWNYEYNKAFAKRIKEKWPGCKIIFGGHQVSERSDILSSDYIDYIILGEGEQSFESLLLVLAGRQEITSVPNLLYKDGGSFKNTEKILAQIPHRVSPYVKGYFDEMVKDEELEFSAILETNRGCPNRCAFCDWGNIKARVRLYDMDLVKKEIDWFSEHKIEYVYAADANFGLFPRDEEIIAYIIKKHAENGYPQKFQATYSKNNPEVVFRINKRLNEAGMSKGATLSFQSMDETVLCNIYRENMPLENFNRLMGMYTANKIATYSELIIGLPGETLESFGAGIEKLLEAGQHMAINFFNCELLSNSPMSNPEYMDEHKIKYAKTEQHQYHVVAADRDSVEEFSRIVVSTDSMSEEDWIKCNILADYVRTFHNLGLLQCIAIYLFYEKNISYISFYFDLIRWSEENEKSVCGKIIKWLHAKYKEVLNNSGSLTCCVPEFGNLTWPLEEGSFLKIIYEYEKFYDEITAFLSGYIDDKVLFEQLLRYQKSIVKTPHSARTEMITDYDFFNYFSSIYKNDYHPLKKTKSKTVIEPGNVPADLKEYAEKVIWFGRKGGQNIITDIDVTPV